MALKATIFKARLQISDMDRDHYGEYPLTLARHPSETDERMMVRLLAFALNGAEGLEFTRGLSSDDEADLWQKSLSGEIDLWIEVGLPSEERLRKACGRAARVLVYSYGPRTAPVWWRKVGDALARFDNLRVYYLDAGSTEQLAALAERNMDLTATIQDGQVWFGSAEQNVEITPQIWK